MSDHEYLLGTNERELARLRTQDGYWADVTEAFLDRLGVGPGMVVLDAGCGPGLVSERLARRVGPSGRVVAVDESPIWAAHVHGLAGVEFVRSRLEAVELPPARFDLVFSRWVFSFLADPAAVVARLVASLKPGGVLAVEDYNHEGVSIWPPSEGFDAAIRATRRFFTDSGGDPWVAGRLPRLFADAGLEVIDCHPNVICGGPDSDAFRWVGEFLPPFTEVYRDNGLMTPDEYAAFQRDWAARSGDPAALFFSPIVLDYAARKAR